MNILTMMMNGNDVDDDGHMNDDGDMNDEKESFTRKRICTSNSKEKTLTTPTHDCRESCCVIIS